MIIILLMCINVCININNVCNNNNILMCNVI